MSHVQRESQSGYDPSFFEHLFAVEDRHFWFAARNRLIEAIARRFTSSLAPGYRVLEVGCGTGNILRFLERACTHGMVMGLDLWAEGLAYARRRTACPLIQADLRRNPFSARLQVIGMFDVLEHFPNDVETLQAIREMLSPNGLLILTVPAGPSLWSYFDEAAKHCRRYSRADLGSRLAEAGFEVEFLSEFMMSAFPLVWAGRPLAARSRHKTRSAEDLAFQELRIVPVINGLMRRLLQAENCLLARRVRLPLGTSLIAVARRSQDHQHGAAAG